MTPEQLAEIRKRCDAATPGPWVALPRNAPGMTGVHGPDCRIYHASFDPVCLPETHERQRNDAVFIAAARTDIPALLDEIEQLRRHNAIERQMSSDAFKVMAMVNADNVKLYAALLFISQQHCQYTAPGADRSHCLECAETASCVTEYCLRCYAAAALEVRSNIKELQAQTERLAAAEAVCRAVVAQRACSCDLLCCEHEDATAEALEEWERVTNASTRGEQQ